MNDLISRWNPNIESSNDAEFDTIYCAVMVRINQGSLKESKSFRYVVLRDLSQVLKQGLPHCSFGSETPPCSYCHTNPDNA
jgi:hypothetical protein